jgi:hypothetical protein
MQRIGCKPEARMMQVQCGIVIERPSLLGERHLRLTH